MSERLHDSVARMLTLVGVRLRDLWQKTLISGYFLKRPLIPLVSTQSANYPSFNPDKDPSQETVQPLFNTQVPNNPGSTLENAGQAALDQADEAPKTPSAAMHSMTTMADPPARPNDKQSHSTKSPGFLLHSSAQTDNVTLQHANACTQTDLPSSHSSPTTEPSPHSSPPTDYSDVESTCGSSVNGIIGERTSFEILGQDVAVHSETLVNDSDQSKDNDSAPEIFDGQSRAVVSKHDDKNYLAILVTKEMIKRLEELSVQSNKLEYSEPRLEEADQKFNIARVNVEYREDLLEDAESQDERDKLGEDIERRRSTLLEDEQLRNDLEQEVVRLKRNVAYMEGLFTEMCQKILTNGGLLELKDRHTMEANSEEGEKADGCTSPPEIDHYPVYQSDYSSVSIDELARRAANQEVRQRHAELIEIEHEFDTRQELYANQNGRFQQMVREGTCRKTQTEFDHADLKATRGLTMELREAEEKYEEALERRNKLGPNEEDQESGFVDDEYDGYPLSWENDGIVYAPVARINRWLEDILDVGNLPDMAALEQDRGNGFREQDELGECDIRSARMSDAWSCQNRSRTRKRIDRWRAIAGRAR